MALVVIASCGQEAREEDEQTYPGILDFEQIDFAAFADTSMQQGSYNVEVHIVEIVECPPLTSCLLHDGITVAEDLNVGNVEHYLYRGYFILTKSPRQFSVQEKYLLSVKLGSRSRFKVEESEFSWQTRELLGYTKASPR